MLHLTDVAIGSREQYLDQIDVPTGACCEPRVRIGIRLGTAIPGSFGVPQSLAVGFPIAPSCSVEVVRYETVAPLFHAQLVRRDYRRQTSDRTEPH